MRPVFLDDIVEKISAVLPQDIQALTEDLKKNIRVILDSAFEKMHLVTREEFEVQKQIVARVQERVQELENKVESLQNNGR
ncbi:MAG: accessory factor UbiK family protein [Gammaproteobacteria bacterium]|nr:accessory factor UbiK family protein [Gammaproteobacteria bacterium]MCD8542031.1 accessory factor UbiK family protein [Gammaproteobacteria bacterium]MCD8573746.1 accessory factor UbiK family protein [Gammaproteobacteria bacterium]